MTKAILLALPTCLWLLSYAVAQTLDGAKQLPYGKHLSAECSGCHRIDGVDNGIPSITGWPIKDFVATIGFYKDGARANPAMVSVAQSLEADQVRALAAYYGSLPKMPTKAGAAKK